MKGGFILKGFRSRRAAAVLCVSGSPSSLCPNSDQSVINSSLDLCAAVEPGYPPAARELQGPGGSQTCSGFVFKPWAPGADPALQLLLSSRSWAATTPSPLPHSAAATLWISGNNGHRLPRHPPRTRPRRVSEVFTVKDPRDQWMWAAGPHRWHAGLHSLWSRVKTRSGGARRRREDGHMEPKRPEQLLASNPGLCLKKKRLKVDWGGLRVVGGEKSPTCRWISLMKWWCWRETAAARVVPYLSAAWVRQAGHTQWEQVGQDLGAVSGYLLWREWT